MLDEETIMDFFPTSWCPLSLEETCNNHHIAINLSISLSNSSQVAKTKLPDYCSENPPIKQSSKIPADIVTMSLAQGAVHNFSFKNLS